MREYELSLVANENDYELENSSSLKVMKKLLEQLHTKKKKFKKFWKKYKETAGNLVFCIV